MADRDCADRSYPKRRRVGIGFGPGSALFWIRTGVLEVYR